MLRRALRVLLAVFGSAVIPAAAKAQLKAAAGDWPAWRGPDRTGLSAETGLLREWPSGGPKLDWKITGLGTGFGSPSIAGGKIYVVGTAGKEEQLICLDAADGKKLWATSVGAEEGGHPGPRSTPTVDGPLVAVISSNGKLVVADAEKGTVKWKKDLRADFGGKAGGWAYAESPLIDGETLVCTPGGSSATIVALKKTTGEVIWKSSFELPGVVNKKGRESPYTTAGYSSAIAADCGGVRQYVQFVAGGVVGVSAKDGKLLWHYDHPANGTANCSTPIFRDDSVFAASAYGNGGGRAKIVKDGTAFKAEEAYFLKEMQNHHGGMVLVGDHIYGTGGGSLICLDFKSGKIAWQSRGVGKGSVAFADGRIYVHGETGPVALVEASPAGYKETGRFDPPRGGSKGNEAWAHPVIAGGKLYLRDWDVLMCYDVKAK